MQATCAECVHYNEGYCHNPANSEQRGTTAFRWPKVDATDWCGSFHPKPVTCLECIHFKHPEKDPHDSSDDGNNGYCVWRGKVPSWLGGLVNHRIRTAPPWNGFRTVETAENCPAFTAVDVPQPPQPEGPQSAAPANESGE